MIMNTIPQPTGQTGGERQRDMLARAEQQRRAHECQARTTHQAGPPERHPGLAWRMMARLRTVIPHPARPIADAQAAEGSQPAARP
jgi:hypothetical protein